MGMTDASFVHYQGETRVSVFPSWLTWLSMQQQSTLILAARGPDGIAKSHPCKDVVRAYRATVFLAARPGRTLEYGEHADSFMSLKQFGRDDLWRDVVHYYFENVDSLPHHYHMHLLHGAEILGYHHPDSRFRRRWLDFYIVGCQDMHVTPETREEMNLRLNDWGRTDWRTTADESVYETDPF